MTQIAKTIAVLLKAMTLFVGPICALGFLYMFIGEETPARWTWLLLAGSAAAFTVLCLLFLRWFERLK